MQKILTVIDLLSTLRDLPDNYSVEVNAVTLKCVTKQGTM